MTRLPMRRSAIRSAAAGVHESGNRLRAAADRLDAMVKRDPGGPLNGELVATLENMRELQTRVFDTYRRLSAAHDALNGGAE